MVVALVLAAGMAFIISQALSSSASVFKQASSSYVVVTARTKMPHHCSALRAPTPLPMPSQVLLVGVAAEIEDTAATCVGLVSLCKELFVLY